MATSPLLEKFRQSRLKSFRPLKASLELTYQCNERCVHCYLDEFKDDSQRTLSLAEWQRVLRELRDGGVLYVEMIGGEAMLNPHFWLILEFGQSLGLNMAMINNGLKIDEAVAGRLARAGLRSATVSLYSLNYLNHDRLTRVRGSQVKTARAIKALRDAGIRVGVNCLITKVNYRDVFAVEEWAKEQKVSFQSDIFITPKISNDLEPLQWRLDREQLRWYFRARAEKMTKLRKPAAPAADQFVCGAGKLKCVLDVYGELYTCLEIRESLGSLKRDHFDGIWFNSPLADKWRQVRGADVTGLSNTPGCQHCPGNALQELGDGKTMTPFS